NNVTGAFVCGTTGEGVALSIEERMRVAERWAQVSQGQLALIVHVGHNSLSDARALAAHAERIGAHAIAITAPTFFKPATVEDLVAFSAAVAAVVPALPFYYYQIPSFTGVALPVYDFLVAGAERIPNLAGAKFTHENLMDYARCLRDGRFDMLFGRDEILLSALALGCQGAVGTTYNLAAPLYHRIWRAYQAGDMATAQADQARAIEFIAAFTRHGGLPAAKAMMKMIGLDCGPVRLPQRNLTAQQYDQLQAELEQIGFFEYCSKV
ncbi:MAG: dihydrodipicolinate synthase family protein, partial [Candidatus Roseilinea sp.]|uniref:dihydrodipicolinate synthase family protein n=1 Tax=Candidatus Roseilinea sp. TaxID=2838777 RepID=UPI00404A4EDA